MASTQGEVRFVKILLDTNVILDVALERSPFLSQAEEVFALAENGAFEAFVSASTFSNLYYVIRKQKSRSLALDFVESIAQAFQIAIDDAQSFHLRSRLGLQILRMQFNVQLRSRISLMAL